MLAAVDRSVALAGGHGRTCAITRAAQVVCWGQWAGAADWARRRPAVIAGTDGAIAVAVTRAHGCALLGDGGVRCWGDDRSGALGDGGTAADPGPAPPTAVPVQW